MTDFFALLGEPRRPWLDPESLKKKFLGLSAQFHPDRLHNSSEPDKKDAQRRYTDLNAAYNCLREPRDRLRHLLELELGTKPKEVQQVPPELMNTFLEVSQLCRDVDAWRSKNAAVSSPLLKVELFEHSQAWTERLMDLQRKISLWQEELMTLLKEADAEWTADSQIAGPHVMGRLEQLYYLFGYFSRWRNQIQERIVQLAE